MDKKKEQAKTNAYLYRLNNPEYLNEYFATDEGYKNKTKSRWKNDLNIKFNNRCTFEEVFETYMASSHCYCCGVEFDEKRRKCLDHYHKTGLPRAILCLGCNFSRVWD